MCSGISMHDRLAVQPRPFSEALPAASCMVDPPRSKYSPRVESHTFQWEVRVKSIVSDRH